MRRAVVSYSGGKDSMLALERAVSMGYQVDSLILTLDKQARSSFFHNIPLSLVKELETCLGIPFRIVESDGEDYRQQYLRTLQELKKIGVEVCIFGDIDIEEHRAWCTNLCDEVGVEAVFPLWGQDREKIVEEVLSKGYQCILQKVRKACFDKDDLGRVLNRELMEEMRERKIDVCGENGEYHTLVVDGPLFQSKLAYRVVETQETEDTFSLVLRAEKEENVQ